MRAGGLRPNAQSGVSLRADQQGYVGRHLLPATNGFAFT